MCPPSSAPRPATSRSLFPLRSDSALLRHAVFRFLLVSPRVRAHPLSLPSRLVLRTCCLARVRSVSNYNPSSSFGRGNTQPEQLLPLLLNFALPPSVKCARVGRMPLDSSICQVSLVQIYACEAGEDSTCIRDPRTAFQRWASLGTTLAATRPSFSAIVHEPSRHAARSQLWTRGGTPAHRPLPRFAFFSPRLRASSACPMARSHARVVSQQNIPSLFGESKGRSLARFKGIALTSVTICCTLYFFAGPPSGPAAIYPLFPLLSGPRHAASVGRGPRLVRLML